MSREFDIIVFGATGFTGSMALRLISYHPRLSLPPLHAPGLLCAQYLDTHYKNAPLKWAIAGRTLAKLEKIQQSLSTDVSMVVADTGDIDSLHAMAKRTKVVITTVGPYLKYGINAVEACATNGASSPAINQNCF
jgi:short subunit dehydrogenase-like uncharacterized protein